jgi:UDPglucose 6-dehydrogenase
LEVCDTWQETVSGADIVVIGTQWREYCGLLPEDLEGLVRGKSVFDGRNVLDPVAWRQAGWQYRGVGR